MMRWMERARPLALLLTTLAVPDEAALAADSAVLWPEDQRSFWMDGPRLLVPDGERDRLRSMSGPQRGEWFSRFLAQDPIPETPENELEQAIESRRRLVREQLFGGHYSTLDARADLAFLHGVPDRRHIVDCEHTFRPLEIWGWARPGATDPSDRKQQDALLVYKPSPSEPYRVWLPSDSKRVLYGPEMEYWLDQYHELQQYISGRRFDLSLCKDAREIDRITGVEGLVIYKRERMTDDYVEGWLSAPSDLANWSRQALGLPLPPTARLTPRVVRVDYPDFEGDQRMKVRITLAVPLDPGELPWTGPQLFEEDEASEPEYRLQILGVAERYDPQRSEPDQGQLFEDWIVRYRLRRGVVEAGAPASAPPSEGDPELASSSEPDEIGLVLERSYRPGEIFQLRLRVRDEVSGASGVVTTAFRVPTEPTPEEELAEPSVDVDRLAVALGDQMLEEVSGTGDDSLVLVPPESDVVVGLWRAEALVTGSNVEAVRFLVDGQQQFRRRGRPYTAELRLAKYPQEQVVRVEGLDADGEVVAWDELVLNQQRGELRIRVTEPSRGAAVVGETAASAEVVVPEERRVRKVEFLVNNELQQTVESAPYRATIDVPTKLTPNDLTFLTVIVELDDGARAEDVRFLNMPEDLDVVDVDLVELYTTVTDRSNRPVPGLEAEDFQVREDGRPQQLAKFELVEDLPITVGITIDTSGSMTESLGEARRAATEFLQRVLTARDRSFAVGFADRPRLIMPRTSDVVAVSQALAGLRANGNTSLYDAVVTSLYYFRGVRGRRALILLSDGEDTASSIPYKDAREYAQRSGVSIYTIGLNIGRLQIEVRDKLKELAGDTGGRSFFISNADELRSVYGEIERELRSQYLLAYTSDRPQSSDDDFREVEVRTVGKAKGLKARTIAGYYP